MRPCKVEWGPCFTPDIRSELSVAMLQESSDESVLDDAGQGMKLRVCLLRMESCRML